MTIIFENMETKIPSFSDEMTISAENIFQGGAIFKLLSVDVFENG